MFLSYIVLWTLGYFQIKNLSYFLPMKKKKTALKSSILMAVWIFFYAALTAQNGPRLNFHIGNVSQDTSVL
jgi:hypothetical protein